MKLLRTIIGVIVLICSVSLAGNSFAQKSGNHDDVEIEIISNQRGSLGDFFASGRWTGIEQQYVISRHNEPYRLRVTNHGNKRVGVVIAVDGRNILSGHPSNLQSNEHMCILEPDQSKYYAGWNVGRHQINGFVFNNMDNFEPGRRKPQNGVGIIALAVFDEQHRGRQDNYGYWKNRNGSVKPYGREAHFVPGHRATAKNFIRYESRNSLCKKGMIQCGPKKHKDHLLNGGHRNNGFVSFPPFNFKLRF
ncbi:hypothetical protein UWK_02847 [Desulfocapsa sulfexigens DSM 10523]|uniref:Uncharacterized protein n=1 Tax=Desulfocapsa sulfexigens (strain DSM 10523 / SB164P1) TaxID=1167006 RepID=M1P7C9_DESSD|nr:hypothetical protein [Desulfocapsa sulfexigens]AGF79378.1 hypothetical protein UWK_02847 [Desulfocapsa sulfexigens DSM 10523]